MARNTAEDQTENQNQREGDGQDHLPIRPGLGHVMAWGLYHPGRTKGDVNQPGVERVVLNVLRQQWVIEKSLVNTRQPRSMSLDRTDQKPNRKILLLAVWGSLLLFTLVSGSIAG